MKKMSEWKDELTTAPIDVWNEVPYMENHHRWLLLWCRFGDDGGFCFSFVSPKGRMYSFYTEGGENSGRVTSAEVVVASGEMNVASYYESWGDSPERLDAVLRLTPKHVLDRLIVLLAAIG